MNDLRNDAGVSVMMAFICGAVVGAAVGLLYAPKTGTETREQLAEFARRAREKAEAITDAARQKVGV